MDRIIKQIQRTGNYNPFKIRSKQNELAKGKQGSRKSDQKRKGTQHNQSEQEIEEQMTHKSKQSD